jgi:hypothetical protein
LPLRRRRIPRRSSEHPCELRRVPPHTSGPSGDPAPACACASPHSVAIAILKQKATQPSKWHRWNGWAAAENFRPMHAHHAKAEVRSGLGLLVFSTEQAQKMSRFPFVRDLDPRRRPDRIFVPPQTGPRRVRARLIGSPVCLICSMQLCADSSSLSIPGDSRASHLPVSADEITIFYSVNSSCCPLRTLV